ncbi:NAD(P)-binding domain-containing protein, partial [Kribbella hippodromi]|uniref:NAD(P)-binding domain-containing protein n=1 Tax=Kribbella hippodromi TaxID=434347 RepID=UPI0031D8A84E
MRIVLLHPGAMGSKLAGELVGAGHDVYWIPDGRSEASVTRADEAGLIGTSFADAIARADVVLCSCAPQGAVGSKLAGELVGAGHDVYWVPDGRSEASVTRADEAGL